MINLEWEIRCFIFYKHSHIHIWGFYGKIMLLKLLWRLIRRAEKLIGQTGAVKSVTCGEEYFSLGWIHHHIFNERVSAIISLKVNLLIRTYIQQNFWKFYWQKFAKIKLNLSLNKMINSISSVQKLTTTTEIEIIFF